MASADKKLIAFDFDHTLIDGNSDVVIKRLLSAPLTPEVEGMCSGKDGWTDYMAAIFSLLHADGVTKEKMRANQLGLPLVAGVKELFDFMKRDGGFEIIIISDSNTEFIEWHIDDHNIKEQICKVFSNPAEFDKDGKLNIEWYHHQDWCQLSSPNLCKGKNASHSLGMSALSEYKSRVVSS